MATVRDMADLAAMDAASIGGAGVAGNAARKSPQAVAVRTAMRRRIGSTRAWNGTTREWFAQDADMDTLRFTRKPRCLYPQHLVRRRAYGIAFVLMSLASRVGAQSPDPEGLQFARADGSWISSAALETDVHFRVQGLLAEVTVEQTYKNDSAEWLEGRYLLPLPDTAAVHALNLQIGERIVVGEVREKAEAQAMYQAAAANGQKAGLVEQNRPNLFRTAVANIGPGETVQVRIGYWQRVDYRDGAFSISLPLTLTPRYAPAVDATAACAPETACVTAPAADALPAADSANRLARAIEPIVSLRVDLTAGVSLQSVESATHAIDVQTQGEHRVVTLRNGAVPTDRDFELHWTPLPVATPQSALFVERREHDAFALAMLLPPTQKSEALPRELILVIDTSGSMHGQSMEQARTALAEAVARLRPSDRFNLIEFNSVTDRLFENAVPADAEHLRVAIDWIAALAADGGTEMAPALQLALQGQAATGFVRQVVFITDAAVGNENELLQQIDRDIGQTRLFPVGIGSAPNAWFLRKAAESGRGTDLMIRAPEQVVEQMDRLFAKLDRPALSGIELRWPAGAEVYPQRLPDLYDGEPLMVVAKLPQANGSLKASGWNTQGDWQDSLMLERGVLIDGVARLWGRSKIEALEDSLRQGAGEEAVRGAIVDLGIEHQLVSRYTSLVAIEQVRDRPKDAELTSLGFDNAAPADELAFAQGATDARSKFALAAAFALLALAFMQRRAPSRELA
jgi:Ca-activated chloride channel homolog